MELPTRRRVKLYALNEEGQWDDKGTGHITCQFSSDHDGFAICLHSEADNELLLEHKVSMQPIYANQNQTIITWTDPESTTDYALSFQEHTGCSDMWAQICNVQGRSVDHEETAQPGEGAHDGADRARRGEHGGGDRAASESVELPQVSVENLEAILKGVTECVQSSPMRREKLAHVLGTGYIQELLKIFPEVEAGDDEAQATLLFHIFKAILFLNDTNIFELLLSDRFVMDVFGVLENDPDVPAAQRISHRDFLEQRKDNLFNEVVPIRDDSTKARIRQTILLLYLCDVVMPRTIEDSTLSTLNSMVYYNKIEVCNTLWNDKVYISTMFGKLRSPDTEAAELLDVMKLLQELCGMAKHLQVQNRQGYYRQLVEHGLFDCLERLLATDTVSTLVRGGAVNVLDLCVKHDGPSARPPAPPARPPPRLRFRRGQWT